MYVVINIGGKIDILDIDYIACTSHLQTLNLVTGMGLLQHRLCSSNKKGRFYDYPRKQKFG
jgi:hypothetical protein